VLYYFKSIKQLKQLSHSQPYLHNRRGRTNLGGEGETEAVVGIEAALIDSTISLHDTPCRLESTRAKAEKDKCKVCYQKGHYQRDCPLLKQIRLDNAKKKDYGQAS
jgi:hypothetical protein